MISKVGLALVAGVLSQVYAVNQPVKFVCNGQEVRDLTVFITDKLGNTVNTTTPETNFKGVVELIDPENYQGPFRTTYLNLKGTRCQGSNIIESEVGIWFATLPFIPETSQCSCSQFFNKGSE